MDHPIPTMIIDPVLLFREGLRRILYEANFNPVWCGDSAPDYPLTTLPSNVSPLLIIGTEIQEAIVQITEVKRFYPSARVVLLVDTASPRELLEAIRYGTNTFLPRRSSVDALKSTIRLIYEGAAVFPAEFLEEFLAASIAPRATTPALPAEIAHIGLHPQPPRAEPPRLTIPIPSTLNPSALKDSYGLSAREISVLPYLMDGMSNKEIARGLGITEATVKVHVKAVLRKADPRNRTQLAMWASRFGVERQRETQVEVSGLPDPLPAAMDEQHSQLV